MNEDSLKRSDVETGDGVPTGGIRAALLCRLVNHASYYDTTENEWRCKWCGEPNPRGVDRPLQSNNSYR